MVMELLGDNLSLLRRRQESHCLSLRCTAAIAMQMLKGIKAVHDHGYLHRDIKPGNFVMGGSKDARSVYIIDYGLSRRYTHPDGTLRPKRDETRWVGSRRYMSPNTHLRKDQGRRDDLWGFLYVVIELYTGTLPWAHLRGIQNLDNIRDIKLEYSNEKLVHHLPKGFSNILKHIIALKWADRPDYRYIHNQLLVRPLSVASYPIFHSTFCIFIDDSHFYSDISRRKTYSNAPKKLIQSDDSDALFFLIFVVIFILNKKNHKLCSLHSMQAMYKDEGGHADTPYDWEDVTRAKSILGPARLSFSSIHSSGGFSDGQQISGGEGETPKVSEAAPPAARGIHHRFHALEDSADFSDDSSARRRKRQADIAAEHAAAKPIAFAQQQDDPPLPETMTTVPKPKKKKRRCVIQ